MSEAGKSELRILNRAVGAGLDRSRRETRGGSHSLAQALGHSLHQVQGKVGRLLDQELEPVLVDRSEFAVRFGYRGRAARLRINQRHFPQKIIYSHRFNRLAVNEDFHFALENDIHLVAGIPVFENGFTRLERDKKFRVPEEMAQLHGANYDALPAKL